MSLVHNPSYAINVVGDQGVKEREFPILLGLHSELNAGLNGIEMGGEGWNLVREGCACIFYIAVSVHSVCALFGSMSTTACKPVVVISEMCLTTGN